ncbi:MAG TPA: hypothetical protein VFO83_05970 [Aggregicoccus sp.]|nr:hypothetical protein [Aggregicoccus sp.]
MMRWNTTVAALVVGAVLGLGGAFGLSAQAAPDEAAGACGRRECRTSADCTRPCGGPGSCVQVDSCNSVCACAQ